jgi:hypothetical protein
MGCPIYICRGHFAIATKAMHGESSWGELLIGSILWDLLKGPTCSATWYLFIERIFIPNEQCASSHGLAAQWGMSYGFGVRCLYNRLYL